MRFGALPLLGGVGATVSRLLPQDVFAANLHSGQQTIVNGLDLAGKGGLVWIRQRSDINDHVLFDTSRGVNNVLSTNQISAETTISGVNAFNANGYTLGSSFRVRSDGSNYVGWSFRRAPKFFDIVTYTGDGTSGRVIPHGLGISPGLIIVKRRDAASNQGWQVYHRSIGANQRLVLNLTQAQESATFAFPAEPTATAFTVGASVDANGTGGTYVAYLFAHDPDTTNGIVQCGAFTTDSNGTASATLGWQPQFLLTKSTASSSPTWVLLDAARGWGPGNDPYLYASSNMAEASGEYNGPTSTGFNIQGIAANTQSVFLAIRAPIFQGPLRPQDAFATSLYTGNGSSQTINTGFAPDLHWRKSRNTGTDHGLVDRIRGANLNLITNSTAAEGAGSGVLLGANGFTVSPPDGWTNVAWSIREAPKFFDIVTYTGDGTSGRAIPHGLGMPPGMWITKSRSVAGDWHVYHQGSPGNRLRLNATDAAVANDLPYFYDYSATTIKVGSNLNANGVAYVAYLFAHDPDITNGIIQCGSFTTDGNYNATVALGWRPQFVITKPVSATGPWYIQDDVRGFGTSTLQAQSTASELGNSAVIPSGNGFSVDSGRYLASTTYVYLAIRAPTA